MSDLFGNHIVGFPTRRLKCCVIVLCETCSTSGAFCLSLTFCKPCKNAMSDQDFGTFDISVV